MHIDELTLVCQVAWIRLALVHVTSGEEMHCGVEEYSRTKGRIE